MPDDREKIGIRTVNGNYVTAINGGGMGDAANLGSGLRLLRFSFSAASHDSLFRNRKDRKSDP